MSEIDATTYLVQIFEQHGLNCAMHNGWVLPNSDLPAVCAFWDAGEGSGVLEVQVFIREGVVIQECFAGIGQGDDAVRDAMFNFAVNSFHVLLAAFWGKHDPDQIVTENWFINGRNYAAYLGNFGTRSSEGVTPPIPEGLFNTIEATIKHEPLGADIHWFRLFVGNVDNQMTFEALKDNEEWKEGIHCLQSSNWTPNDGYYSVRLFLLLRAVDGI